MIPPTSQTPAISQTPGVGWSGARDFFLAAIVVGTMGFCVYCFSGNSLDLFIGGVFVSVLLTPPLSAAAGRLPGGCRMATAIWLGVICSWLAPVFARAISLEQWCLCALVLGSLIAGVLATTHLVMKIGCSRVVSSAIVLTGILAWLTWPIWLSASMPGTALRLPILFHPLFAINHVVGSLGIWTEQQGAYGLTTLGQDVPYQLPPTALPDIAFQCGIAVLAFVVCFIFSRIAPRSMNQMETDANAVSSR